MIWLQVTFQYLAFLLPSKFMENFSTVDAGVQTLLRLVSALQAIPWYLFKTGVIFQGENYYPLTGHGADIRVQAFYLASGN